MAETVRRSSSGPERAEVVREPLGEHREGAVGEVDRGPPLEGLGVEGAAGADVVRDVGDVDADPEAAAGKLLGLDRVVEVAGGLAVDRDDASARCSRARAARSAVLRSRPTAPPASSSDSLVNDRAGGPTSAPRPRRRRPASPSKPISSITSAWASRCSSGQARIRASTKMPSGASRSLPSGTRRRASIFVSKGTMKVPSGPRAIFPTTVSRRRTRTFVTVPVSVGPRKPRPSRLRLLDADEDEVAVEGRARAPPRTIGRSGTPRSPERRHARPSPRTAMRPAVEVRVLDEGELLAAGPDDEALALEGVDLGVEGVEGGFVGRGAEELLRELAEGEDAPPARREGREDAVFGSLRGHRGHGVLSGRPAEAGLHRTRRGGVVRKGGLEPPRLVKSHKVLSLARLPVPPLSHERGAGGYDASGVASNT